MIGHSLHLASLLDHAIVDLRGGESYCWSCGSDGGGHAVDCAAADVAAATRAARRAAGTLRRRAADIREQMATANLTPGERAYAEGFLAAIQDDESPPSPDIADLVQAISEAEREAEEAIRVVNARIQCWDDEAHACVQAMRRAAELVGCLRRLVPSADLAALRDAFGTPGEGDVGAALARLYAPPR